MPTVMERQGLILTPMPPAATQLHTTSTITICYTLSPAGTAQGLLCPPLHPVGYSAGAQGPLPHVHWAPEDAVAASPTSTSAV